MSSSSLVEVRPHQGTYVATLTPHLIVEMIEVMAILEASCAAAAAKRHTLVDGLAIGAALKACETAANDDQPQAFYKASVKLHEAIYTASHNAFLAAQTVALRQRLEPYRRHVSYHAGLMERSNREHHQIVQAIYSMHDAEAHGAMLKHLDALKDSISTMVDSIVTPPWRKRASG